MNVLSEKSDFSTAENEDVVKRIMKLNHFSDTESDERNAAFQSDDDNGSSSDNVDNEEDEIIQGLTFNFNILDCQTGSNLTPKGPIFRKNETNNRPSPYSNQQQKQEDPKSLDEPEVDVYYHTNEDIPTLPNINLTTPSDQLLVDSSKAAIEPRLIVRDLNGEFIVIQNSGHVTIDTSTRKLGLKLPRTILPANVKTANGSEMEILFQPDPRSKKSVRCFAKVEKEFLDVTGKTQFALNDQFVELAAFTTSGIECLLSGVSNDEIQSAIELVSRKDTKDLFKTYGPNCDTMLMTCCCKKDDSTIIRAQVFALTARILSESDPTLRKNVIAKNSSGLSSLDYTTVTNNLRIGVFLAELFFILGQDILCKDAAGNTILHLMARKGDSAAPTMEALLRLRYKQEHCNKVYTSNVANSKLQLPLHIAAMASRCPQNILRILKSDHEQGLSARTWDGSLPLHIACQYSSDPSLLATLLYYDKATGVNERRKDGLTPLHLVAARNEAKDIKLVSPSMKKLCNKGLIPLDENTQVRMIKILLDHGANEFESVENYQPADLIKPDRIHALALLRRQAQANKNQDPSCTTPNSTASTTATLMTSITSSSSGSTSPGQSSGDCSPVMVSQILNDPFLTGRVSSESEASPSQVNTFQASPSSPTAYNGSVSSGFSDESDEDNSNRHLEAIAQALIGHPTIQAVMEAAETIMPDV